MQWICLETAAFSVGWISVRKYSGFFNQIVSCSKKKLRRQSALSWHIAAQLQTLKKKKRREKRKSPSLAMCLWAEVLSEIRGNYVLNPLEMQTNACCHISSRQRRQLQGCFLAFSWGSAETFFSSFLALLLFFSALFSSCPLKPANHFACPFQENCCSLDTQFWPSLSCHGAFLCFTYFIFFFKSTVFTSVWVWNKAPESSSCSFSCCYFPSQFSWMF